MRFTICRARASSLFVALCVVVAGATGQTKPDLVIFDENPGGGDYYDASYGLSSGSSSLTLAGPNMPRDKLPVVNGQAYSGANSGLVQWRSAAGGAWRIFVASPAWTPRNASGYDSVVFFVNAPAPIASTLLPMADLEDNANLSAHAVNLAQYLPSGIDGDTTTWERVSIPLTAFSPYNGFNLAVLKDINFAQGAADGAVHTVWVDFVRIVAAGPPDTTRPSAVQRLVGYAGDQCVMLHWDGNRDANLLGYAVYSAASPGGPYAKINVGTLNSQGFAALGVFNGPAYSYVVRAVNTNSVESPNSDTVTVVPRSFASDNDFLDFLEHASFDFFWYESNPDNGLIKDRSTSTSASSIASVGFGLSAICIGVDHGWITRVEGRARVLATLRTFWRGPQSSASAGVIGYKGFFYHFLDMNSAMRSGDTELSSIDTGLLLAGILDAGQYFTGTDSIETGIRSLADSIFNRVDWIWMTNGGSSLTMGWYPDATGNHGLGFISARWIGYNEGMLLNLLGLGAANSQLPAAVWNSWVSGYTQETYAGYTFVGFPPLFGHQYSHCWVDYRNMADAYMRGMGITYAENTRLATLAQRQYCIANPGHFAGYGQNLWGLTACDGPPPTGYSARGAPPAQNDDGTIAPTAAAGSLPFASEVSIPALRYMYAQYRTSIWSGYGFRDAFNLQASWWGPDEIGIDEGPILLMIENYRTQSVWNRCMKSPVIQLGLGRAGFMPVTSSAPLSSSVPGGPVLFQNFPNPFNPATTIGFQVAVPLHVTLKVYDVLGREVTTLVDGILSSGYHTVEWHADSFASGVYYCRMTAGNFTEARKIVVLK
jgi:hypothetical protein